MKDIYQDTYDEYRDASGDIKVRYGRLKLLVLILGCAAFITACLYILSVAWELFHSSSSLFLINYLFGAFYVLISFIGISFFGSIAVFGLFVLLTNKPNLIINEKGVTLIGFRLSPVFIAWSEIAVISTISQQNNKIILLDLYDMENFLANLGPIQRWVGRLNIRIMNTPVAVSSTAIIMPIDILFQILRHYHTLHSDRIER